MTWRKRYHGICRIIFLALALSCATAFLSAQDDLPDIPDIIRVTVDHSDNGLLIEWEPSMDASVDLYYMYKMEEGTGTRIFVFTDTTFSYTIHHDDAVSFAYSVTAVDTLDGTKLNESLLGDNVHRAVSTTLEFDLCEPSVTVHWTGYIGWGDKISGYRIYGGPAGQDPLPLLKFTNPQSRSFTDRNIVPGVAYVYYVETVNTSGLNSVSPLDTILTVYPDPPDFVRVDQVSVLDRNTTEVRITADISGSANGFRIMRRFGHLSPFTEIKTIWNPESASLTYLDDTPASDSCYQYMVQALYQPEGCRDPYVMLESNPGTTMRLWGHLEDGVALLSWSPYEDYESGLAGYIIQRQNGEGEFIDVQSLGPEVTAWNESIESVPDGFQPGQVQYKVLAVSNPLEQGDPGLSLSNTLYIHLESHFKVPSAFTPGSNDLNAEFRPSIDFAPRSYLLMIFDRNGRVLFKTSDPGEGWDGTSGNGDFVMEGVYVYHIRYTDHTGISRSLTGNVTVVFP